MVKKFFLGMMAVAGLAAVSCESNLEPAVEAGKEVVVSIEVGTPEIATRAYSDGMTATVLQYAVYDEAGNELTDLTVKNAEIHGKTTVEFKLTTGNKYSMIFWAAAPNAPYTVDFAEQTMTVDYNKAVSNDENRDAFYTYVEPFTVTGPMSKTIVLKRPFAQLNIGTNDFEDSEAAGYLPTQSKVIVPVSSSLNLVSGAVNEAVATTFGFADFDRNETFPVKGYEYLAMNYLLVGAEKGLVEVEFAYTDGTVAKSRKVGSVPVQRNHRTNLYGQLLTSDVEINVEIKPGFDGEDNVEAPKVVTVASADEFSTALADPTVGEITINEDFDFEGFTFSTPTTKAASTVPGRDIIIDGNGKTLNYKGKGGQNTRMIDVTKETNGANLTIKNLTIVNQISWVERCVNYNTNGTLTLENVVIKSAEGCSMNYAINLPASSNNAKVEIKNCETWSGAQALNIWGKYVVANVVDTKFNTVDDSAAEGRSVITLGNDGTNCADYSVVNITGGSVKVVYVGEGETKPSSALTNQTVSGKFNVSETTEVVGAITVINAIVYWDNSPYYYGSTDLNAALAAAVPTYKATGVRMIKDLTLPLAKKAIYGTPVAVQMKNGGVFDGCNNTLSVENPEYNAYVVETYGGTIKNLNITTPAGRGIIISSPNEDVYIDNVLVDGPGYALNTTEHNAKNLYVTNSTLNGWTSFAGLASVSFTLCTFGENTYAYWQKSGYDKDYDRLVRPYVQTLFDSCVFEAGFYVDLSALAASATVTVKNCVCGDVEISADNYEQYITIELPSGRTLADCVVFK